MRDQHRQNMQPRSASLLSLDEHQFRRGFRSGDDEAHFLVNVPVELSPPFYAWIASFGRQVKILSPEKVVNGMRDFLQKSMDMYKNDGKM